MYPSFNGFHLPAVYSVKHNDNVKRLCEGIVTATVVQVAQLIEH